MCMMYEYMYEYMYMYMLFLVAVFYNSSPPHSIITQIQVCDAAAAVAPLCA